MHRVITLFSAVMITSSFGGLAASSAQAQPSPAPRPATTAAASTPHSARVTDGGRHLRVPRAVVRLDASHRASTLLRPRLSAILGTATADIRVNYTGFPLPAKAAFQAAVDIWKTKVVSSTPLLIDANWSDLSGYGPGVLGSAGPTDFVANFALAPRQGLFYPVALANAISGADQEPPSASNPGGAEISADFNSAENGFSWYYGTDGLTPSNKVDLETVVMHELGHGLGFLGTFEGLDASQADAGAGYYGLSGDGKNPTIFDAFATDSSGASLMSSSYPNGSVALGKVLRGNGSEPHWDGAWGIRGTGKLARPTLYSPGAWEEGSSFSHLDESTYPAGTANALLSPFVMFGEADHDPGPIMLGMFRDMGWPTACTSTVAAGSPSDAFRPVTPQRIYSVRAYAGHPVDVPATGLANVPLSGVDAVAVNVEIYRPTTAGYTQVLPGCSHPFSSANPSSQQVDAGHTRLESAVVRLNSEGGFRIWLAHGVATINVDIAGWYGRSAGDRYHPVATGWLPKGGVNVTAGTPVDEKVLGRGGIPASGVDAVVLKASLSRPTVSGWLTVSPGGMDTGTGTSAFSVDQRISNLVMVKPGTGGYAGTLRLRLSAGTANVAFEVVGWYGAPGNTSGLVFHPGSGPVRKLDGPRTGTATVTGLPKSTPVLMNFAVGSPNGRGWLGVGPAGSAVLRGTQEYDEGHSISGLMVADTNSAGQVRVHPSVGVATLFADLQGWFAAT